MYNNINTFLYDWNYEVAKTVKLFSLLTEDKIHISIHDDVRTLARLAFHIPQVISDIGFQVGLFSTHILDGQLTADTLTALMAIYKDLHQQMAGKVAANWTNDMLEDEVLLFGKPWKKGEVLSLLVQHEIHHRSQMTIIMRIAGLPVPDLYGPVREDWIRMGLPVAE